MNTNKGIVQYIIKAKREEKREKINNDEYCEY